MFIKSVKSQTADNILVWLYSAKYECICCIKKTIRCIKLRIDIIHSACIFLGFGAVGVNRSDL